MATPFQRQRRAAEQPAPDGRSASQHAEQQRYSPHEVGEVISTATELRRQRARLDEELVSPRATEQRLSMEQVIEIAEELGIAREDVLRALERKNRPPTAERLKAGRRRVSDTLYRWHVAAYLSAVAGTSVIDVLLTDGWDIAVVTTAGWGILVGTHTLGRLFSRRGVFSRR